MLFVWTAIVAVSFWGWGALASRILWRQGSDWGLRGAWGIALTHVYCGALLLIVPGALTPALLCVWIWAGVGAGIFALIAEPRKSRVGAPAQYGLSGILFGLIAVQAVLSFADVRLNPSDDYLAYVPHAKMFLQTGDIFDPFSLRRLAAYGGQSVLDSLLLLHVPAEHLAVLEGAIGLVLLALLLWAWRPAHKPARIAWGVLLIGFSWHEFPRINLSPMITALLLLLALVRTLRESRPGDLISHALLQALLLSSLAVLRAPYLLAGYLFFAIVRYLHLRERKKITLDVWLPLVISSALLVPWAIAMFRSSGTPLFPLLPGNFNAAYGTFDENSLAVRAQILWNNFRATQAWWFLPMSYVAYTRSRRDNLLLALLMVGAVLTAALTVGFSKAMPHEINRYAYPFIIAGALAFVRETLDHEWNELCRFRPLNLRKCAQIICLAWAALFCTQSFHWLVFVPLRVTLLRDFVFNRSPPPATDAFAREYSHVQSSLPLGATILSATQMPFLFDYQRNRILHLDIPGNAAPPPGLPSFRDRNALREYLRGYHISYFIFSDPAQGKEIYTLSLWRGIIESKKFVSFFASWLPHFTELFEFEKQIMELQPAADSNQTLYVLKL